MHCILSLLQHFSVLHSRVLNKRLNKWKLHRGLYITSEGHSEICSCGLPLLKKRLLKILFKLFDFHKKHLVPRKKNQKLLFDQMPKTAYVRFEQTNTSSSHVNLSMTGAFNSFERHWKTMTSSKKVYQKTNSVSFWRQLQITHLEKFLQWYLSPSNLCFVFQSGQLIHSFHA